MSKGLRLGRPSPVLVGFDEDRERPVTVPGVVPATVRIPLLSGWQLFGIALTLGSVVAAQLGSPPSLMSVVSGGEPTTGCLLAQPQRPSLSSILVTTGVSPERQAARGSPSPAQARPGQARPGGCRLGR